MYRIVPAALVLLVGTGCSIPAALIAANALNNNNDDQIEDYEYADTGIYGFEGNATGQMRGEMPSTGAFDRDLTQASVWHYSDSIEIDLHSTTDNWAMLAGGFDANAIVEGETVVLREGEHWIIGCSGPEQYNFIYDSGADEVTVRTEAIETAEGPALELTIDATFNEGWEVSTVVVQPTNRGED